MRKKKEDCRREMEKEEDDLADRQAKQSINSMNVHPGGKQRVMCDGWWDGKPQAMNFSPGVPKG